MSPDEGSARPANRPAAYLLTFACYGSRFHGEYEFAVDRNHNAYQGRFTPPNPGLARYERVRLREAPYLLSHDACRLVLAAIVETCGYEELVVHALHVRTNHVHLVVEAKGPPEPVLGRLKAYASRALNRSEGVKRKRWARHGSTVWLWKPEDVDLAVDYVLNQQGPRLAHYENSNRWRRRRPAG